MKTFDVARIRAAAETRSVVSFDVFDTLLLRTAADPLTAFHLVEKLYGFHGFTELRQSAELEARARAQKLGREDTTLDEIYDVMAERGGAAYREAKPVECEVEKGLLRPNRELCDLCREFISSGKRVIALSDMYHDTAFIAALLAEADLPIDEIYVSSDTGKLKNTGGMYAHLVARLGVSPSDILHIGDNWTADVKLARANGITAIYYPKIQVQASATPLIPQHLLSPARPDRIYASLCAGLGQVAWSDADKPTSKRNLSWWLGYTLVGPLVRLFVEWLYRRARAARLEELYFLRRDGELWQQMFAELFPDVKSRLIYGNRKLLQDADLESLLAPGAFPADHAIAFRISHGDSIASIADDLAFPPELAEALERELGQSGAWQAAGLEQRLRLFLDFIRKNAELWRGYAREKRGSLTAYYRELGISPQRKDSIALVDIGWRLSSFRVLDSVLGFEPQGLFMGIARGAYFNRRCFGFLFQYGAPERAYRLYKPHFIEVLETLFGGTEPSAIALAQGGEFVYDELDAGEEKRISLTRSMYAGSMAFARHLSGSVDYISSMSDENLHDAALDLVDRMVNSPDAAFFDALCALEFSAYAGKSGTTRKPLAATWQAGLANVAPKAAESIAESPSLPPEVAAFWGQACSRSLVPSGLFGIISRHRIHRAVSLIERSGLLDSDWYFSEYPRAADCEWGAAEHYVRYGVFKGYNPNRSFNTFEYLLENPDVARAGMNPLVHYILHGRFELRGNA